MFDSVINFFKNIGKKQREDSKSAAKERLHLVLAQDRANISADFLEMMKQEIIEVIKKYIDIDEEAIDVRLTNKQGEDGVVGAPSLYANIPIVTIKNEARKLEGTAKKQEVKEKTEEQNENKEEEKKEEGILQEDIKQEEVVEVEETTEVVEQEIIEDSNNTEEVLNQENGAGEIEVMTNVEENPDEEEKVEEGKNEEKNS